MPRPPLKDPSMLVVKVTAQGNEDVHAKDYVPIVKLHRVIHPDRLPELIDDPKLKAEVFESLKGVYRHKKYRDRKGYTAFQEEEE